MRVHTQTPCPAAPGARPLRGPSVNPGSWQLVRRHQAPQENGGQVRARKWGGADPTGGAGHGVGGAAGAAGGPRDGGVSPRPPEYRRLISGVLRGSPDGRRGASPPPGLEGEGAESCEHGEPEGESCGSGLPTDRAAGGQGPGPGLHSLASGLQPERPPAPGAGHGGRLRRRPSSRSCWRAPSAGPEQDRAPEPPLPPGPGPPWTGRPWESLTCVLGAGQGEGEGQGPEPRGLPEADTHGERWEKWPPLGRAAGRRLCTRAEAT